VQEYGNGSKYNETFHNRMILLKRQHLWRGWFPTLAMRSILSYFSAGKVNISRHILVTVKKSDVYLEINCPTEQ